MKNFFQKVLLIIKAIIILYLFIFFPVAVVIFCFVGGENFKCILLFTVMLSLFILYFLDQIIPSFPIKNVVPNYPKFFRVIWVFRCHASKNNIDFPEIM